MPDKRVTELDAIDVVSAGDLVMVIDDPGGTAVNKRATITQLTQAHTTVFVSLGGSRAASLPLAEGTYDLVNAEPAFQIPTLNAAVLATARIVADVRSMDASVSITPQLVNASTLAVAGTGAACTATGADYSGTNQHQTVPVTIVSGQTYKAQVIVAGAGAGSNATFGTIRLEIG